MNILQILRHIINAYLALLLLPFTKKQSNLWIIGGHNGQLYTDNAKVFYEYMLREHNDIDIAWMVNKNAPIFDDIKGKKIIKGSIVGYLAFYKAKVSLFSNTFNSDIAPYAFILPFVRHHYDKQFKVYLGHGTISFKKMPTFTGLKQKIKTKIFNSYDLAIAATELEVEVMANSYGIKKSSIVLAGSARNDALHNINIDRKIILIAPTWRPWIHKNISIKETEFFRYYSQLLLDKKFNNMLKEHSITVKLYLHHMFHKFEDEFKVYENDFITLLPAEANISKEIMGAHLLITDYSSICSDFFYLQKPIVFFQFDMENYNDNVGSEIDLETEIFGDVYYDSKSIIEKIEYLVKNDFKLSVAQKNGESFFVNYTDHNNCKRIYNAIVKLNH